jgi:hypothetical protein
LSSIIPINGRFGCWVLISAHVSSEFLNTDIGRPFWRTPSVRMAALIYLMFAILALLMALSARRSLRHFRMDHEIGVAQPAEPVVPIAAGIRCFRDRGGEGGDDGAGFFEIA